MNHDETPDPLRRLRQVSDTLGRVQAERDLYEAIFRSSPDATVVVQADGTITHANTQAVLLFGYEPTELVGLSVDRLVPEGLRATHVVHRASFLAAPATREMGEGLELVGVRRDGTAFRCAIMLAPLYTPAGIVTIAAIREAS